MEENLRNTLKEAEKIIIWVLREAAITEKSKTVREEDPASMSKSRLCSWSWLLLLPERKKKQHSRADFLSSRQELGEVLTKLFCLRYLSVGRKLCLTKKMMAELLTSKLLPTVTIDRVELELRGTLKRGSLAVEAATEASCFF